MGPEKLGEPGPVSGLTRAAWTASHPGSGRRWSYLYPLSLEFRTTANRTPTFDILPHTAQAPCSRDSQEAPGCQSLKCPTCQLEVAEGESTLTPPTPLLLPRTLCPRCVAHPFLCLAPKKPCRPEALHIAVFRWGADGTLAVKEPESVSQAEKRLLVPLLQTGGGPGELGGAELCFADWLI